jgi:hypothetical protein
MSSSSSTIRLPKKSSTKSALPTITADNKKVDRQHAMAMLKDKLGLRSILLNAGTTSGMQAMNHYDRDAL